MDERRNNGPPRAMMNRIMMMMTSSASTISRLILLSILILGRVSVAEEASSKSRQILLVSINEFAHIKPLTSIGKELLRRGHHVTFIAPESCLLGVNASTCAMDTKTWMSTQLPKAHYQSAGPALTAVEKEAAAPPELGGAIMYALTTVSDVNEALLAELLVYYSDGRPRPDLMVADFLTTAAVDAAEALNVPLIVNNPFPICHDLSEPQVAKEPHFIQQGIMVPVHAFPAPLKSLKSIKGRVVNLINHLLWSAVGLYAAWMRNSMRGRHNLAGLPYFTQLSFKACPTEQKAWILQNTVFGLEVPRVLDPRTHMVGPLMLPESDGCLWQVKDCKAAMTWLNRRGGRDRGVIYVNLAGPLSPAPLHVVETMLKALASPEISERFDVLWALDDATKTELATATTSTSGGGGKNGSGGSGKYKGGSEKAGGLPSHVFMVASVPQASVLSHPRVKVAISQSSLEAISDALWHGLPIIGLPLRGYDRGACTLAQDSGTAICLSAKGSQSWQRSEAIVNSILTIVDGGREGTSKGSYPEEARRLSYVMQAAGGVGRAVDLIELALVVGLDYLAEPKLGLGMVLGSSWLAGSMADVRLILFAMVLLLYWAVWLGWKCGRRGYRWVMRLYKQVEEGGLEGEGELGEVGNHMVNPQDRTGGRGGVSRLHQD